MIKFKGNPLSLEGTLLQVGQQAPDFTVVKPALQPLSLTDFKGKVLVISTVPSIDTAVCSLQAKRFNQAAEKFPNVCFLTISEDLPFAQERFAKEASCTTMPLASDYKERAFGMNYGLLIKELKLLARSVMIIDGSGTVVYFQLVEEMTHEPDYDDVLHALSNL